MAETVTVTPGVGWDSDANPTTPGTPVVLTPWAVAPGNTLLVYGVGGDVDDVEFTVYLPLRTRVETSPGLFAYAATQSLIPDESRINVRGRDCVARPQVWELRGRGGLAVLCQSKTGAS